MKIEAFKLVSLIAATLLMVVAIILLIKFSFQYNKIKNSIKNDPLKLFQTEGDFDEKTPDLAVNAYDQQFELLRSYHNQGLLQSRITFWISIVSSVFGFSFILLSIYLVNPRNPFFEQAYPIVSIIAGIIINTVSALFFAQSNRSRRLMADFFDKLRADRKIQEALKLTSEIPDDELRSKLKTILAMHFADIATSNNVTEIIFNKN